jgi:very-short-patch-repair endonuclease
MNGLPKSIETIVRSAEKAAGYPTPAEERLLRDLEWRGFSFQAVVGHFTPDFYHPRTGLVVEIDGPGHYHQYSRRAKILNEDDRRRDQLLKATGKVRKVLRFTNREVFRNKRKVLSVIDDWLHRLGNKKSENN